CWNLSASREAVLQNQGFDETFDVPGLEDVEFAWRLEEAGLQGFYSDAASAYAWHAVPVDLELARRYAEGFSLLRALDKTRSDVLANRYLGKGRRPWRAPGWMIAPFFRNVCGTTAGKVKPIAWICRRMEQYAVLQGYSDARRGRPPRYRAQLR
ncbi:MAG TPA: hypothetical protein PLJ47_07450, partial [Candidatus Hydrogenedentes bacterium]|nr:hypothetical protein [Candidatus Hydrogenedentota bacterium]